MNKNDILTLNIGSNAFDSMKSDFDKVLKRTLGNMQMKESDEATLTLKLNIKIEECDVPDFDSSDPTAMRKIHKPRFDHKVSSVMQIKTEESGQLKGEYELVWDEEAGDFVMKPIDNGQRSLFDDGIFDAEYSEAQEDPDAKIRKQLTSAIRQIEAPDAEESSYPENEEGDYE